MLHYFNNQQMKNFLLLVFLPFLCTVTAQKSTVKFGKIDKADFAWEQYALDSNAHAVILYDYGDASLFYEQGRGEFSIEFHRHTRIKIIDKAGISWADHTIPLWEANQDREKLIKFKGATYNMVNGKILETKVDKKELLEERVHDNQVNKKIALPDVKAGTIIELDYIVRSPFLWNFVDWQFQYGIPVRYSEFNTAYPDWFSYNKQFEGYDLQRIIVNEETTESGTITLSGFRRSAAYASPSQAVNNRINFIELRHKWVAENMPALEAEAYTSNINNYMVKVDFELSSFQLPGSVPQNFTNNWTEINKTLMEAPSFGEQLKKGNTKFLSGIVEGLTATATSGKEKMALIYQHVTDKVAWNKRYGKYATQKLKETYTDGKGNVADINLLLVAMLRKTGLTANPVILSTKDNGILNPYFPSSRQFNYVIAEAQIGDKKILLDATDKDLPMNLLPVRCYNEKGRLTTKDFTDWVDLTPTATYSTATALDLVLNEDLQWEGTLKSRAREYAASQQRKKKKEQKAKTGEASVSNAYDFAQLENVKTENLEDINKPLRQTADITIDNVMDGGDLLYFNPMTIGQLEENPFKLTDRKYPIDFDYPRSTVYSAKFQIPEGYIVEEVPEKITLSLPNKGGMYAYSIKTGEDWLQLTSQLRINNHRFAAEEYGALKEFYNLMVEKQAAQIVLRKKTE